MKRDAAFMHLILTMYGEESKKDSSSFSKLGTWPRLAMYAVLGSIHHEKNTIYPSEGEWCTVDLCYVYSEMLPLPT